MKYMRTMLMFLAFVHALAPSAAHAEPRLASPGFKFMAVGGGETTATFPITVATPSSGLDLHIRLGASAGGTFSVVMPGGPTLDATAIKGLGGRFIDLSHDTAWGQPDPVLSLFMIPTHGRVVDIHVPGPLAAGTYGLRVDYSAPLAQATAFQVNWDTGEVLRTALFVEKPITFDDDHLIVAVSVTEGVTPVAGVTVDCAVVAPDGDELNFVLRDDGDAPDGAAGDGMYSAGVVPQEPGLNMVRVSVSGTTSAAMGSVPFSRTLVKSIEVCRRGANFGAGPFVTRVERAPTNLVTAIVLDAPVEVVIEGDYILYGKLHSPLGSVYEAFTKAHLEVGAHTMSVHVPVTDLPDNQENGEYVWLDVELAGTTSCVPWSLARSASGGSILLNEGDWPHTNATVEWSTVDTDGDSLYDELIATVRVTAEHFGRYTCSAHLVGWCDLPRQRVFIESDEDEQELDGNGLPGTFYLRFRACYTYRVPGEGLMRLGGIGPKGFDGPYGLLNLAIQWTDDRGPAPFSDADNVFGLNETYHEAVCLSPNYANTQFECHEYRPDSNHNGVVDWCDVMSGGSADTN